MTVNIAILGFGTVGTGLPTLISENKEKLSKIFNNYLPSELLKKEIDRILKGGEQ